MKMCKEKYNFFATCVHKRFHMRPYTLTAICDPAINIFIRKSRSQKKGKQVMDLYGVFLLISTKFLSCLLPRLGAILSFTVHWIANHLFLPFLILLYPQITTGKQNYSVLYRREFVVQRRCNMYFHCVLGVSQMDQCRHSAHLTNGE